MRRGPLGAAIGLVTGLLVLAPVLGRGVVLSYDMVFVPDPPITGSVLGTDGSVPRAVPTELLADLLARVLPVALVQQGLLLAVFVLAGAGAARLVPGRPGAAAAALAYAWTPYVAERLLIGHWPFLLGYALLPWVVGAALAARRGGSLRPLLLWLAAAAAAGSTSALIATATALCVLGRVSQLTGGAGDAQTTTGRVVGDRPIQPRYRPTPPPCRTPPGRRPHPPRIERHALGLRPVPRFAVVVGFAAAVNLPWIVPAVARAGGVPADPAGVAAFAARAGHAVGLAGSLLTLGGIWNPATVPAGRDSALAVVALVAVLAALVLGLRSVLADSRGLVVAGAGGLVLAAAGAVPGLDAVLRAVVVHGPGGGLLRDGQKLLAPAALVVALAAGHAVDRLAKAPRTAPWAVLLAVLPVLALPGLAWGVGGRLTAAHYPTDWQGLRAAVASAPPGEVAALPWGTTGGWTGPVTGSCSTRCRGCWTGARWPTTRCRCRA